MGKGEGWRKGDLPHVTCEHNPLRSKHVYGHDARVPAPRPLQTVPPHCTTLHMD